MTDDSDDPQERYDPNRPDDQTTDATMTDDSRQPDATGGTEAGTTGSATPPPQRARGQRNAAPAGSTRPRRSSLPENPRTLVYWGGLAVCGVLAIVALVSFYTSMLDVIRTWVDPEYRSLFRSAFSLVVLVAAVLGVSLTVRELGE